MPKSSPDMTPTSYAVLGLLCVQSWSAYELAQQMARSLHFIPLAGESALILKRGDEMDGFWLKEIRSSLGGRGFELAKAPARGGEIYHVHIDPRPGYSTCTCAAGTYRGACRHVDAITKLIALDLLPPAGAAAADAQAQRDAASCELEAA